MVPADELVASMREDWLRNGNVSSAGLEETWKVIADTFARSVKENQSASRETHMRAIPACTGSGKSRMAILTAAKGPDFGMLIVQQTIAEVEKTVEAINELSQRFTPGCPPPAVAYHSEVKGELPLESLRERPTLVITHQAFRLAVERLSLGADSPKWEHFYSFKDGTRKLVVIDEELSLISEASVTGNDLARVIYLAEEEDADTKRFAFELEHMKKLKDRLARLQSIAKANQDTASFVLLIQPIKGAERFHDFRELRAFLRAKSFYSRLGHKDSQEERTKHEEIDAIIGGVRAITASHLWAARIGSEVALLSSRSMLPEGIGSVVALDATAREDVRNELNPAVEILKVPANVRRYENVSLYIARGASGRDTLVKNAKESCERLMSDLEGRFTKENNVFVVVHLGARAQLEAIKAENFNMTIGHYGEIAGINTRRDDDAVVIQGLNYKPAQWAKQQALALLGGQPQEWHENDGARAWGDHQDIVKDVHEGVILADLIQAANRIRIRKTIDELGNCAPAQIFLLLPSGARGDALLAGLREALPGVQEKVWDYAGKPQRKVRRTEFETALIFTLAHMPIGKRTPAGNIKKELGIPSSTFERYLSRIAGGDPTDAIIQTMVGAGVSYESGSRGRGRNSCFIRR